MFFTNVVAGFIIAACDVTLRYWMSSQTSNSDFIFDREFTKGDFSLACLCFASDNAIEDAYGWPVGSILTGIELAVFLIFFDFFNKDYMFITSIVLFAMTVKVLLYKYVIHTLPVEEVVEGKGADDIEMLATSLELLG